MVRIVRHMMSALLVLGFLVGGGATYAQESGLPAGVVGTTWKLLEIQRSTQDVLSTASVDITLEFDGQGLAGGNSTCNSYSANYQAGAGQSLTFESLISTLRACVDQSLNDLETEYYRALEGVASYSSDGTTLRLFYNNGGSVLLFGSSSTPGTTPGMPRTGMPNSTFGVILGTGVLLVLVGAACVASRRRVQGR